MLYQVAQFRGFFGKKIGKTLLLSSAFLAVLFLSTPATALPIINSANLVADQTNPQRPPNSTQTNPPTNSQNSQRPAPRRPGNSGTLNDFPDPETGNQQTQNNTNTRPQNSPNPQNSNTPATTQPGDTPAEDKPDCSKQMGPINWLICPNTSLLAKTIDSMYGVIQGFLIINPITFNTTAPTYHVWLYFRDITNIIFIIMIAISIGSQLSGIGFQKYNVKRVIPRLIVASVLINLSYFICAFAVDVSNVIGVGLKDLLANVKTIAINSGAQVNPDLSWGDIISTLLAGGGITWGAVVLSGGIKTAIALAPAVVFSGAVAVLAGLLTVSARHGIVTLAIMISPLAFAAHTLPNTAKYFSLWKKLLSQMLIFFPMFSLLVGASDLASFAILSSANNSYSIILGLATRVMPLFAAFSLMKMSGTILSNINSVVRKSMSPLKKRVDHHSELKAAKARAEYYARGMRRPSNFGTGRFSKLNQSTYPIRNFGARTYAHFQNHDQDLHLSSERAKNKQKAMMDARAQIEKRGAELLGFDENFKPIYRDSSTTGILRPGKQATSLNKKFQENFEQKVLGNLVASETETSNRVYGAMGGYLEHDINVDMTKKSNIEARSRLKNLADQNVEFYMDMAKEKSSAAYNEYADRRDYHKMIVDAHEKHEQDPDTYKRIIEASAGYDIYSNDAKIRNDAIMRVVASSYEAADKDSAATTQKYKSYTKHLRSDDLLKFFQGSLEIQNLEATTASVEEIAARGDNNLISEQLDLISRNNPQIFDVSQKDGYANRLARSLLALKGIDPMLGLFGKHINVEVAQFSRGKRDSKFTSFQEFLTGQTDLGEATKGSFISYIKGADLKNLERTAYESMMNLVNKYIPAPGTADPSNPLSNAYQTLFTNMLPSVIAGMSSYRSGSDLMVNTVGFITGQKMKNGKWVDDIDLYGNVSSAQRKELIKQYLGALTADKISTMPSDATKGVLAGFESILRKEHSDWSTAQIIQAAEQLYADSFDQNAVEQLARQQSLSSMKGRNIELLKDRIDALRNSLSNLPPIPPFNPYGNPGSNQNANNSGSGVNPDNNNQNSNNTGGSSNGNSGNPGNNNNQNSNQNNSNQGNSNQSGSNQGGSNQNSNQSGSSQGNSSNTNHNSNNNPRPAPTGSQTSDNSQNNNQKNPDGSFDIDINSDHSGDFYL